MTFKKVLGVILILFGIFGVIGSVTGYYLLGDMQKQANFLRFNESLTNPATLVWSDVLFSFVLVGKFVFVYLSILHVIFLLLGIFFFSDKSLSNVK